MKIRYQNNYCETKQEISYGKKVNIHGVKIKFIPAGHILGSAQIYWNTRRKKYLYQEITKGGMIKLACPLKLANVILL